MTILLTIYLTLKSILTTALSLAKRAWDWTGTIPFLRYLLLGVLIGAVAVGYWNCGGPKPDKQIEKGQKTIINANIATQVEEKKVEQTEAEVKNAEKVQKEAKDEVEKVKKRDSRDADGNWENVKKRFCDAYKDDSRCK